MGNLSMEFEMYLNEVILRADGNAVIPCSFSKAASIQLIVQDKLGRSVLTENFQVEQNTHEIYFQTSNFKHGNYHAWIYLEDKVFVRHFHILGEESNGFFGKFLAKFK